MRKPTTREERRILLAGMTPPRIELGPTPRQRVVLPLDYGVLLKSIKYPYIRFSPEVEKTKKL